MSGANRPARPWLALLAATALLLASAGAQAQAAKDAPVAHDPSDAAEADVTNTDYRLQPRRVSDGVYMFEGRREHFNRGNGGNIVNTAFIETPTGAIVIDTGPSHLYGDQMLAAIRQRTGGGALQIFITHAHPDHFLGNQAFAGVPVAALPATIAAVQERGDRMTENLYGMLGGWMRGTRPQTPDKAVKPGRLQVGGRELELISLSGHTGADLVVFDVASGTLFTGDLVFFERAPTTPDADLTQWMAALDRLQALPFKALVPGHGPVVQGPQAIAQTRDYLRWLRDELTAASLRGEDMSEVMRQPIPERFRQLGAVQDEYERSVLHLYPAIEAKTLPALQRGGD